MKFIVPCLSLLLLTACQKPQMHHAPFSLKSEAQRAATVAIHTTCLDDRGLWAWRGSGVITGKHTVLIFEAELVVDSEYHDIAKLEIVSDEGEELPWFRWPIGPRPKAGDVVCSESAIPTRARKCGTVTGLSESPSNRDIQFTNQVEGGNSGSGLYDEQGRLVGIVTMRKMDMSGGTAASLWAHAEIFGTAW
jgi:hypothetical protein